MVKLCGTRLRLLEGPLHLGKKSVDAASFQSRMQALARRQFLDVFRYATLDERRVLVDVLDAAAKYDAGEVNEPQSLSDSFTVRLANAASTVLYVRLDGSVVFQSQLHTNMWRQVRTAENAALEHARTLPHASVLPVYVAAEPSDPCRLLAHRPRVGPHRARALAAALSDLRTRLRRASSGLAVLHGAPEEAIAALRPDLVVTQAEPCVEERAAEARLAAALRAAGASLHTLPMDALFARQGLPFAADLSEMRRAASRSSSASPPPSARRLRRTRTLRPTNAARRCSWAPRGRGCLRWTLWPMNELGGASCDTTDVHGGGETAALAALDALLWRTDAVRSYAATRNELRGFLAKTTENDAPQRPAPRATSQRAVRARVHECDGLEAHARGLAVLRRGDERGRVGPEDLGKGSEGLAAGRARPQLVPPVLVVVAAAEQEQRRQRGGPSSWRGG